MNTIRIDYEFLKKDGTPVLKNRRYFTDDKESHLFLLRLYRLKIRLAIRCAIAQGALKQDSLNNATVYSQGDLNTKGKAASKHNEYVSKINISHVQSI